MSLHIQSIADSPALLLNQEAAPRIAPVFLVIQRANGHWSPGAKIITVCESEDVAEAFAAQQKTLHPQQAFGVFALRSEARPVANPVEIVRVPTEEG